MELFRIVYWSIAFVMFLWLVSTARKPGFLNGARNASGSLWGAVFWPLTLFTLAYFFLKTRLLKIPMATRDQVIDLEISICVIVGGSLLIALFLPYLPR